MENESLHATQIAQLMAQVTVQQQLIDELSTTVRSRPPAMSPHSLPIRSQFDWSPSDELLARIPEIEQDLFVKVLGDDQKKAIIDTDPPVKDIRYTAPHAVPIAHSQLARRQHAKT